jgi:hypothetical protein
VLGRATGRREGVGGRETEKALATTCEAEF